MDSIDAQLLRILAEDARCSATDISKRSIYPYRQSTNGFPGCAKTA
ncbi:MAG: AsnC family transcriptional regulator [Oscillospiraceae bacterium]